MTCTFIIAVASAAVFTLSTTAFAQGTATEAKAMLEKAAVAMKADKAMNTGHDQQGRRRNTWTAISTCFASTSGRCQKAAPPAAVNPAARKVMGQETLKDATGKMYGAGPLRRGEGRPNHRGQQLHVSKARRRLDTGCKG